MILRILIAAAALSLIPAASVAAAQLRLEQCSIAKVDGRVECGTLKVYEDRRAATGRQIDLYIVVLRAFQATQATEPLVVLQGGPGQAATPLADFYAEIFRDIRRSRDIVLIDQRGTGKSNPLRCNLVDVTSGGDPARMLPPAAVRACRSELSKRADLRLYTTATIVGDLEELRVALGAARVNLYGTSYGTKVAFEYIRHHPGSVRAAIMKGVVPPGLTTAMHARSGQRALDRLFERCEADPPCRNAYPTLRADVAKLFRQVEERSPSTRGLFGEAFRALLYNPQPAARVPLLVRQALDGDFAFFAKAIEDTRRLLQDALSGGMFLSVTCTEDVPYIDQRETPSLTRDTFLGDFRLREQIDACREWTRGAKPTGSLTPVRSDVPVLLISGEEDAVTPPAYGEEAVRYLRRGLHLIVPNNGHAYGSFAACGAIVTKFVDSAAADGLDTSCLRQISAPPFALPHPPAR